jgi:thymidylate synthase
MAKIDHAYHSLLEKILEEGYDYKDESRDIMCKQISSYEFRHNMRLNGFPAITTKKLYWKGIVGELIWFLRGDTNIKYLVDNGINIWNKDAYNHFLKSKPTLTKCNSPDDCKEILFDKDNKTHYDLWLGNIKQSNKKILQSSNLGRVYGAQWRNWSAPILYNNIPGLPIELDQISNLIQNLKDKPMSRRHIVTAWNPAELEEMALPPCHWSFEIIPRPLTSAERGFYDRLYKSKKSDVITSDNLYHNSKQWNEDNIPKYIFDLKWHQRSVDTFLGLPFNIASYGLLMEIISKLTNMIPNELIGDLSNVHIYHSHIKAVKTQLKNQPDKYWKPIELDWNSKESKSNLTSLMSLESLDTIFNNLYIDGFKLNNYESHPAIPAEMLAPK